MTSSFVLVRRCTASSARIRAPIVAIAASSRRTIGYGSSGSRPFGGTQRWLSSSVPPMSGSGDDATTDSSSSNSSNNNIHAQEFVRTRLEPGEWDDDRTDPLYRPQFKSTAKVLHADDFANRPKVGLSVEYQSFEEAMVVLGWLTQADRMKIFNLYVGMMKSTEEAVQKTSHEYVMRVIAQKFNITADRVAAVITLQHEEEQMKRAGLISADMQETADIMDRRMTDVIDEAYSAMREQKPQSFTEEPAGASGKKEDPNWTEVDDVVDVDKLMQDATVRDAKRARMIIDNHVYIEDIDDDKQVVPLDKESKRALNKAKELKNALDEDPTVKSMREANEAIEPEWPEKLDWRGRPRKQYKFVAQTINTHTLPKRGKHPKNMKAFHRKYPNHNVKNTLVEYKGEISAGTLADVKSAAWKPKRHKQEHSYKWPKLGWLDYSVRGKTEAWGRAPEPEPSVAAEATDATAPVDAATATSETDKDAATTPVGDDSTSHTTTEAVETASSAKDRSNTDATAAAATPETVEAASSTDDSNSDAPTSTTAELDAVDKVESSSSSTSDTDSESSSSSDDDNDDGDKPKD